ncbi:MAG: excinuclease ABC subunit B, partial [Mesorhizobium sp.]
AEEAAKAARPNMFRKPHLDEMGADGAVPLKKPLFAKPWLDDMGPGTDMTTPAGAVSRSLFKKQTAQEAHGSDFGIPGDRTKPLFRKNSLDEMTVRRTEKPV